MRGMWSSVAAPLSRAGLGLLMWSGTTTALLHLRAEGASTLLTLQRAGLLTGIGLLVLGSLPWRMPHGAASPSRRTRITIWTTCFIAAALWMMLATDIHATMPLLLVAAGLVLLLAAFGVVTLDAPSQSDETAPAAWRQPLLLPIRLLMAMTTGLALLYLLMDHLFVSPVDGRTALATLTGLGACLALCTGLYWHAVDGAGVRRRDRMAVPLLMAGGPLLAWSLALAGMSARASLAIATAALLAAAFWNHRLFLIEGGALSVDTPPAS